MLKGYIIKAQSIRPGSTRYIKYDPNFEVPTLVENALEALHVNPEDAYRAWQLVRNIKWDDLATQVAGVLRPNDVEQVKFQLYVIFSMLTVNETNAATYAQFAAFNVSMSVREDGRLSTHIGLENIPQDLTRLLKLDVEGVVEELSKEYS